MILVKIFLKIFVEYKFFLLDVMFSSWKGLMFFLMLSVIILIFFLCNFLVVVIRFFFDVIGLGLGVWVLFVIIRVIYKMMVRY